jgi:hypothetical protein
MQVNRRSVVRVLLFVVGLASLLQAARAAFGVAFWTLLSTIAFRSAARETGGGGSTAGIGE